MDSFLRGVAALFVATLLLFTAHVRAADPPKFNVEQLDQMLAPIALFPDALLSQVLMASTYPKDVAEAAEWAFANRGLKGDDAVKAVQDKPWDPSVQSLVAFPQVLAMLGEKPEWVRDLGDAFLGATERRHGFRAIPALQGQGCRQPELQRTANRHDRTGAAAPADDRRHGAAPTDADHRHRAGQSAGCLRAHLSTRSMSSARGGTRCFRPFSSRRQCAGDSAGTPSAPQSGGASASA